MLLLGEEYDEACHPVISIVAHKIWMNLAHCELCCARTPFPLTSPSLGASRLLILVPRNTITSHQLNCWIISSNPSPCADPGFLSAYLTCVLVPTLVFSVEFGVLVLFVHYFFILALSFPFIRSSAGQTLGPARRGFQCVFFSPSSGTYVSAS